MEILSKKEIDELTAKYPLYSQDDKGGDTLALYHLFIGSADWYVTEGSREGDTVTLFGLVNMGGNRGNGLFLFGRNGKYKSTYKRGNGRRRPGGNGIFRVYRERPLFQADETKGSERRTRPRLAGKRGLHRRGKRGNGIILFP